MDSDPKLRRWFRDINRRWFAGALPVEHVALWWEACGSAVADTREVATDPQEFVIRVDPFLYQSPKLVKRTLAHEAIHVHLWQYGGLADHGRRFDQEMQRLCQFRSYRNLL